VVAQSTHYFVSNGFRGFTEPPIAGEGCRHVLVFSHKKDASARAGCGNSLRQNMQGDTEVSQGRPRPVCHALWNMRRQVCGGGGAGDLPQRAAFRHPHRAKLRWVAVNSDFAADLAIADRIPAPALQFDVDAKAYLAQSREISVHEIVEGG